jgi:hypothetical protein
MRAAVQLEAALLAVAVAGMLTLQPLVVVAAAAAGQAEAGAEAEAEAVGLVLVGATAVGRLLLLLRATRPTPPRRTVTPRRILTISTLLE